MTSNIHLAVVDSHIAIDIAGCPLSISIIDPVSLDCQIPINSQFRLIEIPATVLAKRSLICFNRTIFHLEQRSIDMSVIYISGYHERVCFHSRFTSHTESRSLVQLIDIVIIASFSRRCTRTPSSDSKISPVRNARSFHRFFVPGRGITRQVKHRSIGYSEEPLILHQHIIYMCGTTIDSHLPLM